MLQGLALLTVQAHFPKLKPAACNIFDITAKCEKLSGNNEVFLFIGLYLLAFGSAGLKASLPSHGADQFDEKDPKEARQMSSFFNGLLLAVCAGGAVSLTFNVWIQDSKGWDWGFGISTIAIVFSTMVFAFGLPLYRIHVPQRTNCLIEITQVYYIALIIELILNISILINERFSLEQLYMKFNFSKNRKVALVKLLNLILILQVYIAAIRNRNLPLPADPAELYEIEYNKEAAMELKYLPHRDIFRFTTNSIKN